MLKLYATPATKLLKGNYKRSVLLILVLQIINRLNCKINCLILICYPNTSPTK